LYQLKPVVSLAAAMHWCEEHGSIFLLAFLLGFGRLLLDPPICLLFSGLNKPSSLKLYLQLEATMLY